MSKFQIGDRVIARNQKDFPFANNQEGFIADILKDSDTDTPSYIINFDNDVNGWSDIELDIQEGHGLFVDEKDLGLVGERKEDTQMKLKVKYLDKILTKMEKIEKGDLVDLRASRIYTYDATTDTKVEKQFPYKYKFGETLFVKLGFAMEMPRGKKANVYPRSGTFKNYGILLTNSVGQIDNSYKGNSDEWCAMFWCTRDGVMDYNDRILQFEVVDSAMNNVEFDFVDQLGEEDRGGYSSTGVK